MVFDSSSLNLILIIFLIVGVWLIILWSNTRTMYKHIHQVAQQQSVIRHGDDARSLCRAIHRLQPTVHAGIDYVIKEDGPDQNPYIAKWFNSSIPQPKPEELDEALSAIEGVNPMRDHATQRLK